jgi:tetratricopeptide (TPR) repeat protein
MIRCANGYLNGTAKSSQRPICGSCPLPCHTTVARNWLIYLTLVGLTLGGGVAWTATNIAVAQPQDLNAIYGQFEQHYQAGHYAEAERLGKQALDLCEARFGRDRSNCAPTLNDLARVYLNQGKYSQAEGLFQRALAILEKALGAGHHPDVAQILNNLGCHVTL